MERDGETIVFGDVVFATPNDGRSRISSYGQGADKASARQALIDRATGYLRKKSSMLKKIPLVHMEVIGCPYHQGSVWDYWIAISKLDGRVRRWRLSLSS